MSKVTLSPVTLDLVRTLVADPAAALPPALAALQAGSAWNLLTQRIGSMQLRAGQAELALPLLDRCAADRAQVAGGWRWTASVQADAALTLDLLAEEDLKPLGIAPDSAHTMVAYGASAMFGGELGIGGRVPAWGRAGLQGSLHRVAQLRWFVQAKTDALLLEALQSAQGQFVWPDDLAAMLRMANRTDWHGLEMVLEGDAALSMDVDAHASRTGWTLGIDGQQASIGLSFGLTADVKAVRRSRWMLRATVSPRVAGDGGPLGLRVSLHDLAQSTRDARIALGAGADFSAVSASAEKALRAAWPALDNARLDALTQPGSAIGERLRSLIAERLDGPLQGLATVLAGGPVPTSLQPDLVSRLSGSLGDSLDGLLEKLASGTASADALLAAWLRRLLGPAADLVTLDDALRQTAGAALDAATQALDSTIEGLRDAVVGQADAQVLALLQRLGELGAQFDAGLARLDASGAAEAIRRALARYAALRDGLLARLAEGQRRKLALALEAEGQRSRSDEAMFEVWFAPAEAAAPQAVQLYEALCAGHLLALAPLVAAADRAGAAFDARGWALSAVKALQQERAVIHFFGVDLGSSRSWLRDVSVKVDLVTGQLLAARGAAQTETAIFNPWLNRKASLGVQLEVAPGAGGTLEVAGTLSGAFAAVNERHANREHVQALLDHYALATGAPVVDVRLMLAEPAGPAARDFWRQLILTIPVQLDAAQWANFLAQDGDAIDRVSLRQAWPQFLRRYAGDASFSDAIPEEVAGYAAELLHVRSVGEDELLAYLRRFPERYVPRTQAPDAADHMKIPVRFSEGPNGRGARKFLALHRLAGTVLAPRRLQLQAQRVGELVRALPLPPDPAALRRALDAPLQQMQAALGPVALVSETWLGIGLGGADDEPVSWPFVSFVTTMARLGGLAVPPGFVPVAQSGSEPPVRLVAPPA